MLLVAFVQTVVGTHSREVSIVRQTLLLGAHCPLLLPRTCRQLVHISSPYQRPGHNNLKQMLLYVSTSKLNISLDYIETVKLVLHKSRYTMKKSA